MCSSYSERGPEQGEGRGGRKMNEIYFTCINDNRYEMIIISIILIDLLVVIGIVIVAIV